MSVDAHAFRRALSRFASGITVVTARDASGEPVGLTVSAFSSLSLDPPLVLVCLNKACHDLPAFQTGPFAVNILSESQEEMSRRFAGPREARFEGLESETAGNGCVALPDSLAVLECETAQVVDGGDHDIIVGAVTAIHSLGEGRPLVYFAGAYAALT